MTMKKMSFQRSVKAQSDISATLDELMNGFVDLWVNIALHNITRIFVACFMIIYCIVATHGVMQIKV